MNRASLLIGCILLSCFHVLGADKTDKKPNIILVITDDQGYGDFSCHGNPWVKTPEIDKLYESSVRLTDFHVSPTCSPTRAALLTGHYANRTGAWHTVGGRSMVRDSEVMIADILKENGYKTGMFGKWHLGDNHPFRPQDNGFEEVLMHGGGGVGQQPDYWGNDYFNDTYFRNGKPEKFYGYCTDVWFNNAMDFMTESQDNDKPFFCYISTNAPHSPYYVANKYSDKYKGVEGVVNANYYGMVANIDENMGKLDNFLEENQLKENTIFIFMTDNGVSNHAGLILDENQFVTAGFNASMRGAKVSEYEGGHRVPFFIRWPKGGIVGGKDIDQLTAHIDVLPTLVEMLKLNITKDLKFDGTSLNNLLEGNSNSLKKRTLITDSQRIEYPEKWRKSATMQGKWRLVNGKELFNLEKDPEQRTDVASQFPEKVNELRIDYESWWNDVSTVFDEYPAITLCDESEQVTVLHAMDNHLDGNNKAVWRQEHERALMKTVGWIAVNAPETANYNFSLFRYPVETKIPINAKAAPTAAEAGTNVIPFKAGVMSNFVKARLTLDGKVYEKDVNNNDVSIAFSVEINEGFHKLQAEFINTNGELFTAYHTKVTK